MIKLKRILDVILNEANSGNYQKIQNNVWSNDIYQSWMKMLNSIQDKTGIIRKSSDVNLIKFVEEGMLNKIQYSSDAGIIPIQFLSKIRLMSYDNPEDSDHSVIGGAVEVNTKPTTVYLSINANKTISDVLNETERMVYYAKHEANHFQEEIEDRSHSTKSDEIIGKGTRPKDSKFLYLTKKSEIEAYLCQMIEELKDLKKKYSNSKFEECIKDTSVWKLYQEIVFNRKGDDKMKDDIKNKFLSKARYAWDNDFKIDLK